MYTLKIENERGEVFELTHSRDYKVTHISGLMPPKNGVHLSTAGLMDGAEYNSSHAEVRNLVITLYLEGDVEANRQKLYRIFPYKSPCTVYYKNKRRNVKIQGYLELLDGDPFVKREVMQVSLLCPHPYWVGLDEIRAELASSLARFQFPFSDPPEGMVISERYPYPVSIVNNPGDTTVGFTAQIAVEDAEPDLTMTEIANITPGSIMKHCVLIPLSSSEYDPSTQLLDITVNGAVKNPAVYTTDYVTYANSSRDMRVTFQGAILRAGDAVKAFVYTWQTVQTPHEVTHSDHWDSDTRYYSKPDWYNSAVSKSVTMYWDDGVTPCDPSYYDVDDSGDRIKITITSHPQQTDQVVIIAGVTEEQQKVGTNYPAHPETVSAPEETFMTPFVYTANDLIRVYMGEEKLTGWSIETVDISDGSQEFCLHLGTYMTAETTVQLIQSVEPGVDVSGYTDEQVEEGLCHVDGLTLANLTTGETLKLSGEAFRPGDEIEICTVAGDIHVTAVRSNWMAPGTNLLYAADPDSSYPKLVPGENRIVVTADAGQELVSGVLMAKKLYGGV